MRSRVGTFRGGMGANSRLSWPHSRCSPAMSFGFFAYWSREFRPYLRGAAEQFAPNHISLTERLLKRDWWDKAPPCPSECNSGASFARLAS